MPYGRGLDDVAVGRTVNSEGGGVRGTYCGRIVSGCGGPIRTEYTIALNPVSQRAGSLPCMTPPTKADGNDSFRIADTQQVTCRVGLPLLVAQSVKAITESLGYSLISDSPVNGIRCRVAQVRVENAPIPTVAKMFRQRKNAGCRVTVLSLLGRRVDPRQTNYALCQFAANSHRSCLSVLIPQPDLSSGQRPVYATLGVVCRLPNFILKRAGPENHQTAIPRTCLA